MTSDNKDSCENNAPIELANEIEMSEAVGNIVTVDRTLFFQLVKYFADNELLDDLENYLETGDCYELLLDVAFVNQMKRFLISSRRTDPTARLAIKCSCGGGGGGGGGSPSGVRG